LRENKILGVHLPIKIGVGIFGAFMKAVPPAKISE
jgi:hypothetical protein